MGIGHSGGIRTCPMLYFYNSKGIKVSPCLENQNTRPEVALSYLCLHKSIQGYLRSAMNWRPCEASMHRKFRPKIEKIVELLLYLAHN
jgi:hypothetical protein